MIVLPSTPLPINRAQQGGDKSPLFRKNERSLRLRRKAALRLEALKAARKAARA